MDLKICTKCSIEKNVSEFHKSKRNKDGLVESCKECRSNKNQTYYIQNKELINTRNTSWRLQNHEAAKKCSLNYYYKNHQVNLDKIQAYKVKNQAKISESRKEYKKKNKELLRGKTKEYKERNADEIKRKAAIYRKESYERRKDKLNETRRVKEREKRKTDPVYKFKCAIRVRLAIAFKRMAVEKSVSTEHLIGCDYKTGKTHLESMFTEGMGWSNYGKWHVDHIIPLCRAKDVVEFITLSHYTNLQPLWATDNMKKGAK